MKEVEKLLQNKCCDYLLVVTDMDRVYQSYSSKIAAMGMISLIDTDIKSSWKER